MWTVTKGEMNRKPRADKVNHQTKDVVQAECRKQVLGMMMVAIFGEEAISNSSQTTGDVEDSKWPSMRATVGD